MKTFAYMNDISLVLMVTANTTAATITFFRRVDEMGIVANPAKTVLLPPKGHAPTAEEVVSLLENVDVRTSEQGGVTVVGVRVGT